MKEHRELNHLRTITNICKIFTGLQAWIFSLENMLMMVSINNSNQNLFCAKQSNFSGLKNYFIPNLEITSKTYADLH